MEVGPRIVLLWVIIAGIVGLQDDSWVTKSWELFLAIVGINFLLRMIDNETEDRIMTRIVAVERFGWERLCLPLGHGFIAICKGLRAVVMGRQFPPVVNV